MLYDWLFTPRLRRGAQSLKRSPAPVAFIASARPVPGLSASPQLAHDETRCRDATTRGAISLTAARCRE